MPIPLSDKEYVAKSGRVCPLCHVRDRIRSLGDLCHVRDQIRSLEDLQADDVHVYQDCICIACGQQFNDRYELVGYYYEEDEDA